MRIALALPIALALVAGCNSDEATGESHHPHEARLFLGANELTPDIVLPAGGAVTVEVKFYDDHGDEITGIAVDHHTALAFSPGALATVSAVPGQNFQKSLQVQANPGTGTVMIGYGHDAAADEESFGPFSVTVQ